MNRFRKGTILDCARVVWACAGLAALLSVAGCGSTYRPVITTVTPSGPAAQPLSLAIVVSGTSSTAAGTATLIDYSGDTIMAQQPIGLGPKAFSIDQSGNNGYIINSDATISSFPVSTTFQEKAIDITTLFTTTKLTGLFTPSSGVWGADLDQNVIDQMSGAPLNFNRAIPVAPIPIAIVGPGTVGQRDYAISQNNSSTLPANIIPYGVTCNTSPSSVTENGEADAIEVSAQTVDARIPLGKCPVFAIQNNSGNRLFVLNRGDDTISVINSQTSSLNICNCPAGGCLNQNGQAYTCHPTLPLSLNAVANTGITPINGVTGMPRTAGPVYAEFNAATNQLIVADYDGGTISQIDVSLDQFQNDSATFGTTYTIRVGNNPASVTVLPDGSRAYAANQSDGTVTVANLSSHSVTKTLPVDGHPRTVVSTADSLYGKVYVASPDSSLVTVLRTDLDITDTTIAVPGQVIDVRVSTQNGSAGNVNNTSRMPGAGQPCNLPPALEPAPTGAQTALDVCQAIP